MALLPTLGHKQWRHMPAMSQQVHLQGLQHQQQQQMVVKMRSMTH
jgi:hypothetical protein